MVSYTVSKHAYHFVHVKGAICFTEYNDDYKTPMKTSATKEAGGKGKLIYINVQF